MRVFSKSQGRFIDTPETPDAATIMPQGEQSQYQDLQKLLTMAGLKDFKNISKYSTAIDLVGKLNPDSTLTAEQLNRRAALAPAVSTINSLSKEDHPEKPIITSFYNKFALERLGGRGVSEDVSKAAARYALLRQNVVRALQGAKMSDKDMELADTYIPTIMDTKANAQIKMNNLKEMLTAIGEGRYKFEDYAPGGGKTKRPSLDSLVSE